VLVTTMFCGFTLGSALGGVVAAHIVAGMGWRAVLVIGGVLPLVLLPVLFFLMPESARYLVMAGRKLGQVRRVLQRIAPQEDLSNASFSVTEKAHAGFPVKHLFSAELLRGTVFLWIAFFMSLLVIYLLSSWLPTLISSTGMSLKDASLVTAMFQVGGTVGAIALGQLMDRFRPQLVLGVTYALAALFTALIGMSTGSTPMLVLAVFGAGFCVSGGQVGANALSAGFYPTSSRATGVSWANGVGRIGSVLGSMAGGLLLASGLGLPTVFAIVGMPALVTAICLMLMGRVERLQVVAAH
jgi:AAHS family 4-hydroxybenzoate transporter-like MFS transporter